MDQSYAKRIEDAQQSKRGMAGRYRIAGEQTVQNVIREQADVPALKEEGYFPKLSNEKAQTLIERMRENVRNRASNGGLTISMEPQEG